MYNKIIRLKQIKILQFINIEHGSKYITLSIHTGREFEEALITPDQAVVLANELLRRAKEINTAEDV